VRIVPPDPPLSDGVVTLRPWEERDAPEIVAACQDDEIARWLDQVPQPYTDVDARAYLSMTRRGWSESTHASFAVTGATTGELLGSLGVHWLDLDQRVAEIGYWVRREARGRGVAARAVRLAARWAFEQCGMLRLQLRADEHNVASQRVAERTGFRREGVLRSVRYNARQRRRVDFVIYSLLPGELEA
jgi:RimJ/RimL family protein N-acetyltransferase